MENEQGLKISKKMFISTAAMLLAVMLLAGILTLAVPQGQFDRVTDANGNMVIPVDENHAVQSLYHPVTGQRLAVWRWLTAPAEVFINSDSSTVITAVMIILFILLIGGTFMILEKSGVLKYLLGRLISRYGPKKYMLLAVMVFVCMLLGSTMGLFEETVTLVPITVVLAVSLGWDSLVGIGMSILSVGFGFAAGTLNPFTIGVTQKLAGLPLFSGLLFRVVLFAAVYAVLVYFLIRYARRVEKDPAKSLVYDIDKTMRDRFAAGDDTAVEGKPGVRRAMVFFGVCLLLVFVYIIIGLFVPMLSDYSMPVMALMFAIGGIGAGIYAGGKTGAVFKDFGRGMLSLLPGAVLIILAMSARQIIQEGQIMDTLLLDAYNAIHSVGPYGAALLMYLFVLLLEFVISGSAAKAFLIMPLAVPLSDLIGLTHQTTVQAFSLADGFANMVYPTNAVLLITLGLIGIPYIKWLKWTWKLQLLLAAVSMLCLIVAVALHYGPF
jgi:uncharacterized ion transporter superfamily protein YfcC